jgi:hypothetical protein
MRTGARPAGARGQRGTILFIALIVLVAMSLAGIALMRSVDTNVLIAGNLAFRQGATAGGDWGIEHARAWIAASGANLNDDRPAGASFYWANWQQNLDLFGNNPNSTIVDYKWDTTDPADLGFDSAGNRVQYVIHRLCDTAGAPHTVQCVRSSLSAVSSGGQSKLVQGAGHGNAPGLTPVLYRVTVKVTGPRNTVSFVQAVLN